MNDIQFEDGNITPRQKNSRDDYGNLMKFLLNKGLSKDQAKKTMFGIAIGAFLLSLFFWF